MRSANIGAKKHLFIFLIIIILFFTLQPASLSSKLSNWVSGLVLEIYQNAALFFGHPTSSADLPDQSDFNILFRSIAHTILYFLITLMQLFYWYRKSRSLSLTIKYSALGTFFLAIGDEFIQKFVPGRGAQLSDLIVDYIGGVFAIVIFCGILLAKSAIMWLFVWGKKWICKLLERGKFMKNS